jgi:hypothetical protein
VRSNVKNLVEAIGQEFRDVRRDFERRIEVERAARIALEHDVRSLRDQLDSARRLDRLEGAAAPPAERSEAPSPLPPRPGLRLAGSLIA